MLNDHELLDHARKGSELCAIAFLHRCGLYHPKSADLVEQKHPKFITLIQPLLEVLRKAGKNDHVILKTKLRKMIHELKLQAVAGSRSRSGKTQVPAAGKCKA